MINLLQSPWFRRILPLMLVLFAIGVATNIYQSAQYNKQKQIDKVQKRKLKKTKVVKVAPLHAAKVTPFWYGKGIVAPAQRTKVVSEISGRIVTMNPDAIPGAHIKKGEPLISIDDSELQLELMSKQAQLNQALAALELEMADQQLAQEELALLSEKEKANVDINLILREPQIKQAQSRVEVAQSALKKVELDIKRSIVRMPFDGHIVAKNSAIGSRVGISNPLFDVISSASYWVEIKIPRALHGLVNVNQPVQINTDEAQDFRIGHIKHYLPNLDENDHQLKLLIEIDDPMALRTPNKGIIMMNDFVEVTLFGHLLEDVWVIHPKWLTAENEIWVANNDNTLAKRGVKIRFKGKDRVYIDGPIEQGDRILTSKPALAVEGEKVKIEETRISFFAPDQMLRNNLNPLVEENDV